MKEEPHCVVCGKPRVDELCEECRVCKVPDCDSPMTMTDCGYCSDHYLELIHNQECKYGE